MSIIYQIPHNARYLQTKNIFTATFNNPELGKYDFGVAGNTDVKIQDIFKGTIYLIERVVVGGNIPEVDYSGAIETFPQIKLRFKKTKTIVYKLPLPIVKYYDNLDVVAWVYTDIGNDELMADFTGLLDQTADLVGITEVKINVSFAMYAIEDTNFKIRFRDKLSSRSGSQVAGDLT